MSNIHDVFYLSQLKKCKPDPSQKIPKEAIELQENLTYLEERTNQDFGSEGASPEE